MSDLWVGCGVGLVVVRWVGLGEVGSVGVGYIRNYEKTTVSADLLPLIHPNL